MRAPAAAVLVLVLLAGVAVAYSVYEPVWYDRPEPLGIPVDYVTAVDADDVFVYAAADFHDRDRGTENASIVVYRLDGTVNDSIVYYYKSGNLTSNDVIEYGDYILFAGAVAGTWGFAGVLTVMEKANLSNYSAVVFNTSSIDLYVSFYGVCLDAGSNIYLVGVSVNVSKTPVEKKAIVAAYYPNLTLRDAVVYSVANYNLTFHSCIVGPDGYLYVASIASKYLTNAEYPVYVGVLKIDRGNLSDSPASSYKPLFNSQGIVVYHRYPVDISTDGSRLVLAFTYTDELPDPSNPTLGGAVAWLDTSLQWLSRRNFSTGENDALLTVEAGSDGSVAAAGGTAYDFGTGLGNTYLHGILLVFNSTGGLEAAVLTGSNDNGTLHLGVAADYTGRVYTGGSHYADTVSFYNVTSEASAIVAGSRLPRSPTSPAAESLSVARASGLPEPGPVEASVLEVAASRPLHLEAWSGASLVRPLVTPSGGSSGLVVAYQENISSPPPPIPEPWLAAVAAAAASIAAILLLRRP